ncbi:hypothetical protein DTO212C5_8381 [Paecilomyces variotii]|nr:hypothetical protein DTO212C5_8381 [Paecilomyces variotii]
MGDTSSNQNGSIHNNPWRREDTEDNVLETSQSHGQGAAAEARAADEAHLSEVAAPPPIDREEEEEKEKRSIPPNPAREQGIPLSELAAPPPVSREPSRRRPWDHQVSPTRESPPPPELEQAEKRSSAAAPSVSKRATQLYVVSYLVFFAILGTLARLGLQALTFYPGAPVVTSVLWANVGGCILMGFFGEDRNLFREEWGDNSNPRTEEDEAAFAEWAKKHKSIKKTIPLYIGLTTGFCGSLTSFSSFMRDVFLALSNNLSVPVGGHVSRNGGYSFMALVAVIVITVALSLSSLIFGAHCALALDPLSLTIPFRFTRRVLDPLIVFLAWGCWLGAVFMAIWPPDRHDGPATHEHWRGRAVFAIVFAPLGCLLRFYASLHLNARIPAFPLGTFAVNIFGTIIEGMCYDLQHVSGIGALSATASMTKSILTSCQVLQGVMDGFCGCTTTISTWVAELNGLGRRRHAYFYGIMSVGVALAFLVIIMGSLRWTIGFKNPVCA